MARTPSTEDVYEGDGTTAVFQFHFPYLAASDVFVSVDGVNVSFTLLPGSVAQVQTTVPPAVGTVVKVYRNTLAYVPEHLFASGVPFLPRYVDENNRQLLYASQEAINDTAVTAAEALVIAEEAKQIAQEAEDKIDGAIIDSSYQLRLDLANPTIGVSLVARSTVAVPSIYALQALVPDASQAYLVEQYHADYPGGGGVFHWEPLRPKAQHNGWRIVDPTVVWDGSLATLPAYLTAVGGVGTGCFVRRFNGEATPEMAGAVSDWNGTTGTNIGACFDALIADTLVTRIQGSGKPYWFGIFAANQTRFRITRNIPMDLGGSLLVCQGNASLADSSSDLFLFEDCNADISNYEFDDLSYSVSIDGRGIRPVSIASRNKSTWGHTIGPARVLRGQSLLTVGALGALTNRSAGITFRGAVHGEDVYYGVNLANNGDHVKAAYTLGKVNRASFVYGCSDVQLNYYAAYTWPASAAILFSQYSTSIDAGLATERIKIVAHIGEINGPVLIASDVSAAGAGTFRDIDVDLTFDILGANIPSSVGVVRMGAYDNTSNLITEMRTVATDNIKIRLNPGPGVPLLGAPIRIYTPSPNHGRWIISDDTPYEMTSIFPKNAAGVFGGPVLSRAGRMCNVVWGDLTLSTATARIHSRYLAPRKTNHEVTLRVRIAARNGVGSTTATAIAEYLVLAFVDTSGNLYLRGQVVVGTTSYSSPTPAFTLAVSPDNMYLQATCTGYTGASADLVLSVDFI